MKTRTIRIKSLKDYLGAIEKLESQEDLFMRGQSRDWPLIPKISRPDLILQPSRTKLQTEERIFNDFKRFGRSYPETANLNGDLNWLALAQHHGLPTRLLDWTTNALAALWFAVESPDDAAYDGSVFVYKPHANDFTDLESLEEPFEITRTSFIRPQYTNSRIVAQSGVFSIHNYKKTKDEFSELSKLRTLKGELTKILIPGESKWYLRYDLDRCGVNKKVLFPDLDGLAKYLFWVNYQYEDEKGKNRSAVKK